MNGLAYLAHVANALTGSAISLDAKRCVAVRHRLSSCTACLDVCAAHAITKSANTVLIDAEACIGCGACALECPTGAISLDDPSASQILAAARDAQDANGGAAVIACRPATLHGDAETGRYALVPCLTRVDEGMLCELVARGMGTVTLADGGCDACPFAHCAPLIDETVRGANELLSTRGLGESVRRASTFPEEIAAVRKGNCDVSRENVNSTARKGSYNASRRGFFQDVASLAKDAAVSTVADERAASGFAAGIVDAAGVTKTTNARGEDTAAQRSLYEKLQPDATGALPTFSVPRRTQILEALDSIGDPSDTPLNARGFATVQVDITACDGCGLCALFCPTGALRRAEEPFRAADRLVFSACACADCRLCADVCPRHALNVSADALDAVVFGFDPRPITTLRHRPRQEPTGSVAQMFLQGQST